MADSSVGVSPPLRSCFNRIRGGQTAFTRRHPPSISTHREVASERCCEPYTLRPLSSQAAQPPDLPVFAPTPSIGKLPRSPAPPAIAPVLGQAQAIPAHARPPADSLDHRGRLA